MDTLYFKAGLSNGETAIEGKGRFEVIPGELSPINRLYEYIADEGLTITSLSIVTPEGHEFHAPSASKAPRFHAFGDAQKPLSYQIYRKAGGDVVGDNTEFELFTVVETAFEGFSTQLWVSHARPYQAYTLVKA